MVTSEDISRHRIWHSESGGRDDSTDSTTTSTSTKHRGNKVCVKDEYLFYATGSVVRCISLAERAVGTYKTLDMPLIDFEIMELSLNKSEDIMLIIGQKLMYYAYLPLRSTIEEAGSLGAIRVKYQEVDPYNNKSNILKVLWHPISRYNTSITVLRDDEQLRSFELLDNPLVPDLEMSVSLNRADSTSGYDMSTDFIIGDSSLMGYSSKIVSMAFGSDGIANGSFTLYLLASNGDIYAVCPWAPSSFLLTKEAIERSYDSAIILERESRKEEPSLQRAYMAQTAWLTSVYSQLSLNALETHTENSASWKNVDYYIFKRPASKRMKLTLQGPFLVQPYPEELYLDQDEIDATDITRVTTGNDNADLTVLLVAFKNGNVFTLLKDSPVLALWQIYSHDPKFKATNSLILLNTSYLTEPTSGLEITFLESTDKEMYSSGIVYALTNQSSLYRIDVSPWLRQLQQLFDELLDANVNDASIDTSGFYNSLQNPSSAYTLLSNSKSTFGGIFTTNLDDIKSPCTVLVSESSIMLFKFIEDSDKEKGLISMVEEMTNLGDRLEELKLGVGYHSALVLEPFGKEIDDLLNVKLELPKVSVDLTQYVGATYRSMEFFVGLADSFSHEMEKLLKASILIKKRLAIQKNELRRQLTKTVLIKETLDDFSSPAGAHSVSKDRLQRIIAKQRDLDTKARSLIDKMSVGKELPLSDKEKNWAKDLEEIEQQVNDLNEGLETRVKKLSEECSMLINELWLKSRNKNESNKNETNKANTSKGANTSTLRPEEYTAIENFLDVFYSHVQDTKDRLERALSNADIPNFS